MLRTTVRRLERAKPGNDERHAAETRKNQASRNRRRAVGGTERAVAAATPGKARWTHADERSPNRSARSRKHVINMRSTRKPPASLCALRLALNLCGALAVIGCSASVEKPAVGAAMNNPKTRRESLEATLRVTDEHPEYVDELFALTLQHPKTLDRFLSNAATHLEEEQLSRLTAKHLSEHPASLRQVMIASLDASSDKPPSLDGISQAMQQRPQLAAIALIQRDAAVRAVIHALMQEVLKNQHARAAFLAAIRENSAAMAQVIAPSSDTLAGLLRAFGKVGLSHGGSELDALVKAIVPKSD